MIENASHRLKKLPAAILFDEWGTSGKVRPTLSHLLQLLIELDQFQAADYVAVKLLKEAPPKRPDTGPAAKIDISLPEDDESGILAIPNNMSYPPPTDTIINENKKDFYEKRGPTGKLKLNLPAKATVATQSPSTSDNASRLPHDTDLLPPFSALLETDSSITHNRTSTNSSYSDSSIHESAATGQESSFKNMPIVSASYGASNTTNTSEESNNIPLLSALPSDSSNSQSYNIPDISGLQHSTSDSLLNDDHAAYTTDSSQSDSNLPISLEIPLQSPNSSVDQSDDNIPNISLLRL